jgi:AcrR family transcriptional regulator
VTSGLRERKKLATRTALHRAALELVAERGLDDVSVDDIAARADVSPRTFFNYYGAKDDAVIGLDPDASRQPAEAFAARPADEPPQESMRVVQRETAEAMAQDADLWALRMTVIGAHPELVGKLTAAFGETERLLAAAIAERTGDRVGVDVLPTLLAATQAGVMRTALHRWLTSGFTASLPALVDEAWDALAAGLRRPSR